MTPSIVDRLNTEFSDILSEVDSQQPTLSITASDTFRKNLLLAAASYFEDRITTIIKSHVHSATNGNSIIESLVIKKAISRQYHTMFNWNVANANTFFAIFGDDFCDYAKKIVKEDEELASSIKAFLEIGSERNRLVHQNFGQFALEKDVTEIFDLYKKARIFVESIGPMLDNFSAHCLKNKPNSPDSDSTFE